MITDEFGNELTIGDFICAALSSPNIRGYIADVREGGLSVVQSLRGAAPQNQVSNSPGFITVAFQIPIVNGSGAIPGVTKGYGPKTPQPEA